MLQRNRRILGAVLTAGVLSTVSLAAVPAQAITGDPAAPETLPASASAMWQTNGSVWALAYSNNVLYAAGDFTAIRPPGATDTSQDIAETRIAAFHANEADPSLDGLPCTAAQPCQGIGAWTDKQVSARVYALAVTPDGSRLYAGGDFSAVGTSKRSKLAGFDLTKANTQPLVPTPQVTGQVRAIATDGSSVFVAGAVSALKDPVTSAVTTVTKAGSFNVADGTVRPWAPSLDGNVYALMIGPGSDSANLVLGGDFRTVNGAAHSGIAQVDVATGAVDGPMSNTIIPGVTTNPVTGTKQYSDVKTLTTDGTNIYVGAEGTGYGIFDGTVKVDPATGLQIWKDNCLGATQGIAYLHNVLYVGSHSHNCSFLPRGGFPQLPFNGDDRSWHHMIAETATADGTHINGELLNWFPNTNAGPGVSSTELGPRAVLSDGTNLYYGGEFTTVNGIAQRGLTWFAPVASTAGPTAPLITATSAAPGKVTVRFTGSSDLDDKFLSYTIARDGTPLTGATTPSTASPVVSWWWNSPVYTYRDTSVPAGSHTYTVTVADTDGHTNAASTTVSVATVSTGGYQTAVLADHPSLYWRLDETSGTTANDSSGNASTGTYRGSFTLGRPGAINGDAAVRLNNAAGNGISSDRPAAAPLANYSIEMWIRADATNRGGGRLIGWSNAATGTSTTPNRTLYMLNSGQLVYSIFTADGSTCHYGTTYGTPGTCYVWSKQAYNDGTWHHVVVTQSSTTGMALYVDGTLVSASNDASSSNPKVTNGIWRVGVDNLTGSAQKPSNGPFLGDIDEIAVYPVVLTPAQITTHWQAAN